MQRSITFFGHVVNSEGTVTDSQKMEAIQFFPTPQTVKDVQRFLGMAGWYHRLMPRFAERSAPLNALKHTDVQWAWTPECQAAFEDLKGVLISSLVLQHPNYI